MSDPSTESYSRQKQKTFQSAGQRFRNELRSLLNIVDHPRRNQIDDTWRNKVMELMINQIDSHQEHRNLLCHFFLSHHIKDRDILLFFDAGVFEKLHYWVLYLLKQDIVSLPTSSYQCEAYIRFLDTYVSHRHVDKWSEDFCCKMLNLFNLFFHGTSSPRPSNVIDQKLLDSISLPHHLQRIINASLTPINTLPKPVIDINQTSKDVIEHEVIELDNTPIRQVQFRKPTNESLHEGDNTCTECGSTTLSICFVCSTCFACKPGHVCQSFALNQEDESESALESIEFTNDSNKKRKYQHQVELMKHEMSYSEIEKCLMCGRYQSRRCHRCQLCSRCSRRQTCNPLASSNGTAENNLSKADRVILVLSSRMDRSIYDAFSTGEFDTIFSLIDNGMDVNYARKGSDNATALMAACLCGDKEAVTKLLQLGANSSLQDIYGHNAVWFAKKKNHQHIIDLLSE